MTKPTPLFYRRLKKVGITILVIILVYSLSVMYYRTGMDVFELLGMR